jgi:hypothetical protein
MAFDLRNILAVIAFDSSYFFGTGDASDRDRASARAIGPPAATSTPSTRFTRPTHVRSCGLDSHCVRPHVAHNVVIFIPDRFEREWRPDRLF